MNEVCDIHRMIFSIVTKYVIYQDSAQLTDIKIYFLVITIIQCSSFHGSELECDKLSMEDIQVVRSVLYNHVYDDQRKMVLLLVHILLSRVHVKYEYPYSCSSQVM